SSFVFQPLPNYLPPDNPIIRDATQSRWGCLMDTNTPGRLKVNVPNWFDIQPQVDALGGNQYRLYLPSLDTRIAYFKPGDTFVKSATWGEFVMYSTISTNITYEQITSYAGGANHFIGHWNDSVNFLRCASRIKPGRLVSNGCGGYVGAGYRTGFWIEECLTEGMFDDAVNISNEPAKIQTKTAPNQFVATGAAAQYILAGDHVTIYTPTLGSVNGTFAVLSNTVAGGLRYITVDGDIGEVFPGIENWSTGVYDDDMAHPYAYVRNSTFRNSRRFGCLFKSHGGVIEGNTFEGLSEAAVQGENECSSFDGGFDCRDVRVLNNTVKDCGYSSTFLSQSHGSIEFSIVAYGTVCTQMVHRNVEIRGNEVYDWDRKGLSVENAQNALIHSNIITSLDATTFVPGRSNYGIYLDYTDGAIVTDNDLRDPRPMTAAVQIENSTNFTTNQNWIP
ncbi:MAG: right-handed parallel beta-helix repeat-containing protein, partial [Kiritimatiellales bacterium]|nr:right-handed parallel beta-helix repeat-containing protein [Kiritimatiellales bacterium]